MVRDTIRVMVNGLPGNMATEVANLVVKRTEDMYLIPWSLTGPETDSTIVEEWSKNGFSLIYPSEREHVFSPVIDSIIFPKTISVDFTQPTAIEGNVDWYIEHGLPFVMGTTGYTPEQKKEMVRRVEGAGLVAVIAPNMAAPIVAFQAVMEKYAREHPGAFNGYNLEIEESHQAGKKDTSGTARAMVQYFNQLGIPFTEQDISMIRDPELQRHMSSHQNRKDFLVSMDHDLAEIAELDVPEKYLKGHGWHWYDLKDTVNSGTTEEMNNRTRINFSFWETMFNFLHSDVFKGYENKICTGYEWDSHIFRRSPDRTVVFEMMSQGHRCKISHRVNGGSVYAACVLDAVRFLDARIREGARGKVYSMQNVLGM